MVRALVGLQAQDRAAARLALLVRAATDDSFDGVVRMWAMRGTLHLVAAEDRPLILSIFGPLHLARGQRRLTQLGLDPDDAERSTAETAAILAEEGPLTRHELAARLRDRGVPVDAKGQAPIHVVARAAHAGVLVEVGVRGREELYGAIEPGPLPDRDEALEELARRYAAAHAPATAEDFASWSGLPAADVRRAWHEPEPPRGDPGEGPVRLLPAFDEWLLGWASRDLVVPRHARRARRDRRHHPPGRHRRRPRLRHLAAAWAPDRARPGPPAHSGDARRRRGGSRPARPSGVSAPPANVNCGWVGELSGRPRVGFRRSVLDWGRYTTPEQDPRW